MQEIINAMLRVILQDANQQKPIMFSVKRGNDLFVEFHSGYMFNFDEGYLTITDMETQKKSRVRFAPDAKISNDVLEMLKDWLNKDFNSGIVIEDESEDIDDSETGTEDDGASEQDSESQEQEQEEKKEVKRQIPSSWAKKK